MRTQALLALCCFCLSCSLAVDIYVPYLSNVAYQKLAYLNLGILIPVHNRHSSSLCSEHVRDLALLQRLEAINFAVAEVNNRSDILPNHTMGYVMYDDCYHDLIALAQTLRFSRTTAPEVCFPQHVEGTRGGLPEDKAAVHQCENASLEFHDVLGVIGSESSVTTVHSGNLLTVFQLPQISYLATNPDLTSTKKYRMFQRVVPSDVVQVTVMIDMLLNYNWTYVSVVYVEGDYGFGAFRILQEEADKRGVCFAQVNELREDFTQGDYNNVVYGLLLEKNATVVVVFATQKEARMLMQASKNMIVNGRLTWLASDAWARDVREFAGLEEEALGLLSVNFHSRPVSRYDDYFGTIRASTTDLNPWIDNFWREHFHCSVNSNLWSLNVTQCDPDLRFADHPDYLQDKLVSLVFDAVYTYAYSLDAAASTCENLTEVVEFFGCMRQKLPVYLKNVVFNGETGEEVVYDDEGNRKLSYDIFNMQNSSVGFDLVMVGLWNGTTETLHLDPSADIQWSLGELPKSLCSDPCGVGQQQLFQHQQCCWVCQDCQPHQYTSTAPGYQRCYDCEEGTWPDAETRTTCEEIVPTYLSWEDPLGIFLAVLASCGIALCVATATVYILNRKHPLIKACSRELSALMLFGIVACYAFVYTFLLEPSDVVCFITLFGTWISFTLIYAPLTTRTIRIYRIFESGRKMNRKPRLVGSKSQLIISLSIILCHAAILITWGMLDPPTVDEVESSPGQLEKICRFPLDLFIFSLCYNGFLIIVCAFFAFKTRKLPDNFNESRFISFCVYATVVLWVAFVPVYIFLTVSTLRVLFLSLMLSANATVALVTLYFPKIYALYYVNRENLHVTPVIRRHGAHADVMAVGKESSSRELSRRTSNNKVSPEVPGWF